MTTVYVLMGCGEGFYDHDEPWRAFASLEGANAALQEMAHHAIVVSGIDEFDRRIAYCQEHDLIYGIDTYTFSVHEWDVEP